MNNISGKEPVGTTQQNAKGPHNSRPPKACLLGSLRLLQEFDACFRGIERSGAIEAYQFLRSDSQGNGVWFLADGAGETVFQLRALPIQNKEGEGNTFHRPDSTEKTEKLVGGY